MHFNFRIGADDPEVADECKFGPCAYISISGLLSPVQKLLMNASSGLVLALLSLDVSCHSLGLSNRKL